jgi:hypothetical protein
MGSPIDNLSLEKAITIGTMQRLKNLSQRGLLPSAEFKIKFLG